MGGRVLVIFPNPGTVTAMLSVYNTGIMKKKKWRDWQRRNQKRTERRGVERKNNRERRKEMKEKQEKGQERM